MLENVDVSLLIILIVYGDSVEGVGVQGDVVDGVDGLVARYIGEGVGVILP